MRFLRSWCVVVVFAGVFVASAAAFGFTDEAQLPPDMELASPYSFQLGARNGCPPYYYEQQSGFLPPGVSINQTGLISGTPQIGGTFQTWLAVKDQCPGDSSERLFQFYVVDPSPLSIKTAVLKSAVNRVFYRSELVSSEAGVLTWTVNTGQLPAGLTMSRDGAISGVSAVVGSFTFKVKVNDGRRTATKELTLVVVPRLGFVTKRLPRLRVGHVFRANIVAQGGVAPRRLAIVGGSLPPGVRLASGVFSGKPRVAGRFRVAVRVTDAQGAASTRTLLLVVHR
jgi:large repetitive protein